MVRARRAPDIAGAAVFGGDFHGGVGGGAGDDHGPVCGCGAEGEGVFVGWGGREGVQVSWEDLLPGC